MKRAYIHTQKELGENLRLIREKQDLKQKDIAKILCLDRSTYTYYETGKTWPNVLYLIKLSEALKIDFSDFICKYKKVK